MRQLQRNKSALPLPEVDGFGFTGQDKIPNRGSADGGAGQDSDPVVAPSISCSPCGSWLKSIMSSGRISTSVMLIFRRLLTVCGGRVSGKSWDTLVMTSKLSASWKACIITQQVLSESVPRASYQVGSRHSLGFYKVASSRLYCLMSCWKLSWHFHWRIRTSVQPSLVSCAATCASRMTFLSSLKVTWAFSRKLTVFMWSALGLD